MFATKIAHGQYFGLSFPRKGDNEESTASWYAGSMRLCLAVAIMVLAPSSRPIAASAAMAEPIVHKMAEPQVSFICHTRI